MGASRIFSRDGQIRGQIRGSGLPSPAASINGALMASGAKHPEAPQKPTNVSKIMHK